MRRIELQQFSELCRYEADLVQSTAEYHKAWKKKAEMHEIQMNAEHCELLDVMK